MALVNADHPAFKTKLCKYFHSSHGCAKTDSECRFQHGPAELPKAWQLPPSKKSKQEGDTQLKQEASDSHDMTVRTAAWWDDKGQYDETPTHSAAEQPHQAERAPRPPTPTTLAVFDDTQSPYLRPPRARLPQPPTTPPPGWSVDTKEEESVASPIGTEVLDGPMTFGAGEAGEAMDCWLHEARMERLKCPWSLQNSSMQFKTGDDKTYRCPMERVPIVINNRLAGFIETQSWVNITWCAMLYGRREKVLPLLEHTIILGFQLRKEVQPHLLKHGLTFANVLLVTSDSLSKEDFQAVAQFWSIRQVEIPNVHPVRVAGTSSHLQGDDINPAHVFLKVHALDMKSDLSIISDVDMHVCNGARLAKQLITFLPGNTYGPLLDDGQTACVSRTHSRLGREREPRLQQGKTGLSYCFAMFRPSDQLRAGYAEKMRRQPPQGKFGRKSVLSDQDLFVEVFKQNHVLLPIQMLFFPSWLNHNTILPMYLEDLPKDYDISDKQDLKRIVPQIFDDMGTIHFSSAFSVTKNIDEEQQIQELIRGYRGDNNYMRMGSMSIRHQDLVTHFLAPLLVACHERHKALKATIHQEILRGADHRPFTTGWARAAQIMSQSRGFTSSRRPFGHAEEPAPKRRPSSASTAPWHNTG